MMSKEKPWKTTIIELRTKLEVRTWFLRIFLGLNVALITGLIIREIWIK